MPEPHIALKVATLAPPAINDTFTRTVSGGWGPPWSIVMDSAAKFSVDGGRGVISLAGNGRHGAIVELGSVDQDAILSIRTPVTATGQAIVIGWMSRYVDNDNHLYCQAEFRPDGRIWLSMFARLSAANATLASAIDVMEYTAGTTYRLGAQVVDDVYRARVWPGGVPGDWQQAVSLDASPDGTQAGPRALLLSGNTNSQPVAVTVDNVAAGPYWTDLAPRLHYGDGGGPLTIDIGRQTELQDVEPTRIAATLKNGDGWLNPRNPSSPYYGTWEQGRQVRVTETVDGEEIDLATGFLEIPDVQVNSPNLDQPCSISAVDRLGRLAGAPSFEGTLAEHVRAYGGRMVLHYPLDDAYPHMSSDTVSTLTRVVVGFDTSVVAEPADLIEANGLAGPPGDDRSYIKFAPIASGGLYLARARLETPVSVPVAATDTIAVSVWLHATHPEDSTTFRNNVVQLINDVGLGILINNSDSDGLEFRWIDTTSTTLSAGGQLEREAWRLVTARINLATGGMDLWCGSDKAVSGTAAVTPSATTLTRLALQSLWEGGVGQLQVRVGPSATTMTRAMHLAQYAHGYRGLHRQTVAERIATLADFAGVPAADLDLPAEASTPMQAAKLAGVNPSQAKQEAATTGQDILMTTPQGRITLVPRSRRYNQPVTLTIPFGWIMRGGIRYRPDKPVTDTVASRAGGGTARRVSEPLRARYGVLAQTVTLDSDVDADPANWASWTLAAFGQPRTRCPLLRINLLKRTMADRKALLRLRVGDRIQLTDMPANSPEDVPHLIVQGVRHVIGPHRWRVLELNTSPLLGPTPGVAPACPVVGDLVSTAAIIAY